MLGKGREEDEVKQSQLVIDCYDQGIVVNWNFVCLAGMLQCLPSKRLLEIAAQSHTHKEPMIWNSSMQYPRRSPLIYRYRRTAGRDPMRHGTMVPQSSPMLETRFTDSQLILGLGLELSLGPIALASTN
jgi:hypothetical protein